MNFEIEIAKSALLRQTNRILKDFREMRFRRNQQDRDKTFENLQQMIFRDIASRLSEIGTSEIAGGECASDNYWLLNTIDGASNFKSSISTFSSSATLIENGQPILCVFYMPFHNRCFTVEKGRGLHSEEGVHSVSTSRKGDYLLFSNTGFPGSTNPGSNSWAYCATASGAVDGFILELNNIESKIAELFIKEGGGVFSRIGQFCIGSNSIVHEEIRKMVINHLGIKKEQISFCCGPTQKPQNWSGKIYERGLISISHRSPKGIAQINKVIDLIKANLKIPNEYRVLLMNGSATGAIECGFFNFLGHRNIINISYDVFGRRWASEIGKILDFYTKKTGIKIILNDIRYKDDDLVKGEVSKYENQISNNIHDDMVFVFSGTSNGFVWKRYDLLKNRDGLNLCDATSAAFAEDLPWPSLDVTCFSFQKALGAEAGLGCVVLSPKALSRLKENGFAFLPPRVIRLDEPMFTNVVNGKLINTISMMNLQEVLENLEYSIENGGHEFLAEKCLSNQSIIERMMPESLEFLLTQKRNRCRSLLAIRPKRVELQSWDFIRKVASLCEERGVHSIEGLEEEMPCWRFWTGPMNWLVERGFSIFVDSYNHTLIEFDKKKMV